MNNPVSDHKTDPQSPVHAPAPHRNPAAGSLSPSRKKGAVWLLSILMAISLPLSACGKKAPAEAETVSSDLSSAESFAAAQESAPEGTGEDGEAGDGINPGIEATPIPAAQGGFVNYITFCHSLTTSIVPATELLESNPEYFSLQENGQRTGDQLCLSNPNVVNRAIEDVLRLINEGYDDTAPLNISSSSKGTTKQSENR